MQSNYARLYTTSDGLTQFGRMLLRAYSKTVGECGRRLEYKRSQASYRSNRSNRGKALLISVPLDDNDINGWHYLCAVTPIEAERETPVRSYVALLSFVRYDCDNCRLLPRALEIAAKDNRIDTYNDFLSSHSASTDENRFF